jgi:hypothetical protein
METLTQPTETKARKKHYCNFCSGEIMIGQTYLRSTHVYDGDIYNWKSHKYCSQLADRLNMYDECEFDEGLTSDGFMEIVNETYLNILIDKIPKNLHGECSDIFNQLRCVVFNEKLWYVIKYFNKFDKEKYNK